MRNGKKFEDKVSDVTVGFILALLCIVYTLIVFGPFILAVNNSPWWLSLYALYLAVFLIAVVVGSAKKAREKADRYEEDMYEDH